MQTETNTSPQPNQSPQVNQAENTDIATVLKQVETHNNNADWYEWWKDRVDVIGVGLAVLVVFVGFVSNRLGTRLNKSNKELITAKDQLSILQQQKFQLELSKQQERAANAERLLFEVTERSNPRRFTSEQGRMLSEYLQDKKFKGVIEVLYPAGNNEAFNFANDIHLESRGAGWVFERPQPDKSQRPWSGVRIEASIIGDDTSASVLRQALAFAGVPTAASRENKLPQGKTVLFVGQKENYKPLKPERKES